MLRSSTPFTFAFALWFCATGCQFDVSPLHYAPQCGGASGVLCEHPAITASPDAGAHDDPALQPPTGTTPQLAPPVPPSHASTDAGAPSQPTAHDAGHATMPPAHAPPPAVMPSVDAGTSDPAVADAASDHDASNPGGAFAACTSTSQCATGLLCTADPNTGLPVPTGTKGYCATPCSSGGWGGNPGGWTGGGGAGNPGSASTACVQPSSGTVAVTCQVVGLCLLDTCDGKQCPDGLSCMQVSVPTGSGQPILVSACQGSLP